MGREILQTDISAEAEPLELWDFLGFKELVFAFFLLAGMFKAIPALEDLPFDLTVISALVTLVFVIYSFRREKKRRYGVLFLLLGVFITFVPTLFWTHWHDYAVEKASRFYTLTLLATVGPVYLLRTQKELRRFLCAFTLISALAVVGSIVSLITIGRDAERLIVFSASTISLARAVGVVFLFLTVWTFRQAKHYFIVFACVAPLIILLVAVGERGPLLGTAFAFIAVYLLLWRKPWLGLAKAALLILAVLAIFRFSTSWIPETSLLRMGTFFGGDLGESELERIDFFRFSLLKIPEHPWGLGLGGFADLYGASSSADRVFPHNIFLETFMEGGWLAGIYLIGLSWRALRRSYLSAIMDRSRPELQFLFCLLLFFLANEQVSGELNDSKALFAFVGLSVGLGVASYEKAKSRPSQFRTPALRSAHIS